MNFIMLQPAERFVSGEYYLPAIFPIAMIMLLLVRVRTIVVATAFLEESIRYTFLGLVFLQMLPDLARILQGRPAAV